MIGGVIYPILRSPFFHLAMIDTQSYNHSLRMVQALMEVNQERGARLQRLATGKEINRAEDDSASLSVATKLQSRIRGQAQALENIASAKDLLTIKEQNLSTVQELLYIMQEKATQGANDTLDTQARNLINQELSSLADEINTALTTATYGDVSLDTADSFSFQVDEGSSNTYAIENSDGGPQTLSFGNLNDGIASWDSLTGTGYIMYTDQDIYSRFGANPGFNTADNLVAVVNQGGQWYWSAWGGLTPFTPTNSDRLLAEVDFDADTVTNLEGTDTTVDGIDAGYTSGDLVVTPNQFGDPPVASPDDFSVTGTQVIVPPETLADRLSFSSSELDVSTTEAAQALMSSVETALDTLNSEIQDVGAYQQILTLKSELLNRKVIDQSAARTRIEDADFAKEQVELIKLDILQNAGFASLSQMVEDSAYVLELL